MMALRPGMYVLTEEQFKPYREALEKQIPKKPELWHNQPCPPEWADDDWGYRCPACGNEDIDYPEHHCRCGQALDWSDDEYGAYQDEMGGITELIAFEVE